ncbi:hypothetical protein WR25_21333 [Diploscapter pachys]|uniref:Uncharacterized protein n=1 Tax=Diploscapter pachys TaxID=2018661 RepID=A0A2A2KC74_9BILA|nr:hypothetical protein WR25_21333 [Diploscapter pachys]
MVRRHAPLQADAVGQRLLRHRPLAPHRPVSAHCAKIESDHRHDCKTAFLQRNRAEAATLPFRHEDPVSAIQDRRRRSQHPPFVHQGSGMV